MIKIKKELIEEILDIEIDDFKIESLEDGIIDVYVTPKRSAQHININITISKTGVEFKE